MLNACKPLDVCCRTLTLRCGRRTSRWWRRRTTSCVSHPVTPISTWAQTSTLGITEVDFKILKLMFKINVSRWLIPLMSKELWNHLKKVMHLKYTCISGLLVSLIYSQESVHNCSCIVTYKDEVSALSFTPCLMCLSLCRIFGCTESVFSLKDEIYEGVEPEKRTMSTLDMLGGSPVKKSIERPQVLTLTYTWSVAFSFKTLVVYTHKHKMGSNLTG